jgi:hypothetical protein
VNTVQAYQAQDGSLHLTEKAMREADRRSSLSASVSAFLTSQDPEYQDTYMHALAPKYLELWERWKDAQ